MASSSLASLALPLRQHPQHTRAAGSASTSQTRATTRLPKGCRCCSSTRRQETSRRKPVTRGHRACEESSRSVTLQLTSDQLAARLVDARVARAASRMHPRAITRNQQTQRTTRRCRRGAVRNALQEAAAAAAATAPREQLTAVAAPPVLRAMLRRRAALVLPALHAAPLNRGAAAAEAVAAEAVARAREASVGAVTDALDRSDRPRSPAMQASHTSKSWIVHDHHCAKTGGGARNSCSICRRAVLDASPLDRGALRAAHRVAFSKPQLV